jgi:hypothetical protein
MGQWAVPRHSGWAGKHTCVITNTGVAGHSAAVAVTGGHDSLACYNWDPGLTVHALAGGADSCTTTPRKLRLFWRCPASSVPVGAAKAVSALSCSHATQGPLGEQQLQLFSCSRYSLPSRAVHLARSSLLRFIPALIHGQRDSGSTHIHETLRQICLLIVA